MFCSRRYKKQSAVIGIESTQALQAEGVRYCRLKSAVRRFRLGIRFPGLTVRIPCLLNGQAPQLNFG
jgi:hypothetical protein